jgi:hypothetical protein
MAKNQKKMQMVEDDEVENVGIMQGFMDDIEELMEEIAAAEMSGGEDQDMAKLMDRRPDSPEVLMNNLRGDYRSIDARREELADLVGMSAAVETPDDVLALLQPVLAQQGIEALTPSSSLPFGTMAPAAVMPPPPMEMAAAGLPAPPVEPGGVGSLPMGMAEGGIVQNFQDGSGEAGVTPARRILDLLAQQPVAVPDLMARTQELTPQYADILGTGDRDAVRAQMLFDIGQAALGFAGNVGPQGQALRGSMAARLAQATSALPGQIGARAAELRKGEQAARLAALQGAQAERSAAMESNIKLSERQLDLLQEIAKSSRPIAKSSRPGKLSAYEEKIQDLMTTFQLPREDAVRIVNEQVRLEPNSGNLIIRDPITGEAEVVDVGFPEPPPDPTRPPEVDPKDLSFDVATGTGLFAGLRNLYSSTLGQLPFLPAALETEEAAQRLRFLERDAISSLATTTRPSVVEQARILATIPQALDFSQNPEIAQESLANFVDLMGQVYVDDVKYSNDISNPKTERDKSAARARAVQRTINSLLREDASKLYFDTINNVVTADAGEFGDMTREQLLDINVADLLLTT